MPIVVSSVFGPTITGQQLVNRAMRLIGQLPAGESPSTDESTDVLVALNALLDSARTDKLFCYATQTQTLTLSNGDESYTIGPGGDLDTTMPVDIIGAWILEGDYSYPVAILTDDEYDRIVDKEATSDYPDRLNYRRGAANGTILVYPVPNGSATLKIRTRAIAGPLSLAATVELPAGWEQYLTTQLALDISPEFEVEPRPALIVMARNAKRNLSRINSAPVVAHHDLPFTSERISILTDQ